MAARLKARPEILDRRREIVEHPFGSIKQWMNQGAFLMKGLENVRAEFSLTALVYNLRRALTASDPSISEQGCAGTTGCSGHRAHSSDSHSRRITQRTKDRGQFTARAWSPKGQRRLTAFPPSARNHHLPDARNVQGTWM